MTLEGWIQVVDDIILMEMMRTGLVETDAYRFQIAYQYVSENVTKLNEKRRSNCEYLPSYTEIVDYRYRDAHFEMNSMLPPHLQDSIKDQLRVKINDTVKVREFSEDDDGTIHLYESKRPTFAPTEPNEEVEKDRIRAKYLQRRLLDQEKDRVDAPGGGSSGKTPAPSMPSTPADCTTFQFADIFTCLGQWVSGDPSKSGVGASAKTSSHISWGYKSIPIGIALIIIYFVIRKYLWKPST